MQRAASFANFGVVDIDASPHSYGFLCDLRWEHRLKQFLVVTNKLVWSHREIKAAILFSGPVLGSIKHTMWRNQETGVYHTLEPAAGKRHAVVVVGWDNRGNWIVQNSWGEEWGDGHGRGRIAADLLQHVIDPTVDTMLKICLYSLTILATIFILFALMDIDNTNNNMPAP